MFWIVDRAPRDEDTDPLLWIATGRRSGQDDMAQLMVVLKDKGIPHQAVRKPPMANFLVKMDDKDTVIEVRPDDLVFAYGSTSLHEVSAVSGWSPGYIDGPPMDECDAKWGKHMLNFDSTIDVLGTMPVPKEPIFIRPVDDGKPFAGKIEIPETFESWRQGILDIKSWTNLPPTTKVVIAKPQLIFAEWRVMVVDGQVITSSLYREGLRLRSHEGCPSDVEAFVKARVEEWQPRPAFVMDIALTKEGLYIVETNSISSAGFYAMNMEKYVDAIEQSSLARK
jgi:hypothetical protein